MNVSTEQLDAIREMINIGVGRAAGILNQITNSHIHLQIPIVKLLIPQSLRCELNDLRQDLLSMVSLDFEGSFSGLAGLLFPTDSAKKLVTMLTGDSDPEEGMDTLRIGTLSEIGNIFINGVMGSISNLVNREIYYSLPRYIEGSLESMIDHSTEDREVHILLAIAQFKIEHFKIQGDILIIFDVGGFNQLLETLEVNHEPV